MKQIFISLLLRNEKISIFLIWLKQKTYSKILYNRQGKLFKKNALKVLVHFHTAMEAGGYNYWISFGTLLGAYREKHFIEHDDDLDVGMYLNDYSPGIQENLEAHGFRKVREYLLDDGHSGRMDKYVYLGVYIDIFYFARIDEKRAYYYDFVRLEGKGRLQTIALIGGLVPRRISLALESIGEIEFLGYTFPAPVPVKQHLADRYGEDFMVPNKDWHSNQVHDNPNISILHEKVARANEF